MTDTLIAIISVFIGILGATVLGAAKKKYSFGFTGNTLAGVFGSIFFIKLFERLGFDPVSIMKTGTVSYMLFTINMLVSFIGGVVGLIAIKLFKNRLNK